MKKKTMTKRFIMKQKALQLFLCLIFLILSVQPSKADEILYLHRDLYLQFILNTDTKEAMLGTGTIGEQHNALFYPGIEFSDTNFWEKTIVPETISYGGVDYTVTSIAPYAFYRTTAVMIASLPETIKQIGENAFAWCTNLKHINIPSKIEIIKDSTFYLCRQLTEIRLPTSIKKIGGSAFGECWELQKINIPGTCTEIGNNAFSWCTKLTNLIFEEGNETLRCGYSYGLSINYQGTFDEPEFRGIFADSPLDTLFLGREFEWPIINGRAYRPFLSISNYGDETTSAYRGFTGKRVKRLIFCNNLRTIQDSLFWNSSISNELVLPKNLKTIGHRSFNSSFSCIKQNVLLIPDSVSYIGNNAFEGCSFNRIELNGTCQEWGDYSFKNCMIEELVIGKSVKSIGNHSFQKNNIKKLHIPESVNDIGIGAFILNNINFVDCDTETPPSEYYCFGSNALIRVPSGRGSHYRSKWPDALIVDDLDETTIVNVRTPGTLYSRILAQDIQLSDVLKLKLKGSINQDDIEVLLQMTNVYCYDFSDLNMEELPMGFFQRMDRLYEIKLPYILKTINNGEFSGCTHLVGKVMIPSTCQSIGQDAFMSTSIDSLECDGDIFIKRKAFGGSEKLSNLCFNGSVIIEDSAFYATKVDSIYIPDNSVLGSNAFAGSSIKKVVLADGVNKLGYNSLGEQIEKIVFEGNVDTLEYQLYNNLREVHASNIIDWCNLPFQDTNIMENFPLLYLNNELAKDIIIPNGINVRDFAFYNCKSLNSVKIESGINTIPKGLFKNCTNLSAVSLPATITEISALSFSDCTSLHNIYMPEQLEEIGDSAFSNCRQLPNIEFPSSLIHIGEYSFDGCSSLSELDFPVNIKSIGNYAFSKCNNLTKIVAPWHNPFKVSSGTFEVLPNCYLYIPILTATKYLNAGWNIPNMKEAGILKINSNTGGEVVYDSVSIRGESGKLFFSPFKSFYLSITPDNGFSIKRVKLNGENVTNLMTNGKLLIEEPELDLDLSVIFADNDISTGDSNGDGVVNITDAIAVINYILKNNVETFYDYAADVNEDESVNVTDAVAIIHKTLKQ